MISRSRFAQTGTCTVRCLALMPAAAPLSREARSDCPVGSYLAPCSLDTAPFDPGTFHRGHSIQENSHAKFAASRKRLLSPRMPDQKDCGNVRPHISYVNRFDAGEPNREVCYGVSDRGFPQGECQEPVSSLFFLLAVPLQSSLDHRWPRGARCRERSLERSLDCVGTIPISAVGRSVPCHSEDIEHKAAERQWPTTNTSPFAARANTI